MVEGVVPVAAAVVAVVVAVVIVVATELVHSHPPPSPAVVGGGRACRVVGATPLPGSSGGGVGGVGVVHAHTACIARASIPRHLPTPTLSHTDTHAHRPPCPAIGQLTHCRIHVHMRTSTHTHARRAPDYAHTRTRTHMSAVVLHAHGRPAYARTHTQAHTHAHPQMQYCAHMSSSTRTPAHALAHTYARDSTGTGPVEVPRTSAYARTHETNTGTHTGAPDKTTRLLTAGFYLALCPTARCGSRGVASGCWSGAEIVLRDPHSGCSSVPPLCPVSIAPPGWIGGGVPVR
jgi:hypothetical protein